MSFSPVMEIHRNLSNLVAELSAGTSIDRLLVRVIRQLDGRRILTLDNATFLGARVHGQILSVLTECPQLHCILLTRESSFPVLNAELMIDTTLIDADDLMLTDDEMHGTDPHGPTLSSTVLEHDHHRLS